VRGLERLHHQQVQGFAQRSDLEDLQRHRQFFQIHVSNLQAGNRLALQALLQTFLVVR
jgi:hypothetical protein